MSAIAVEILVVLLLILVNGVLSMAEISVVSARKTRLQQQVQEGDKKAQAALELANAPNQFLATIQIGITLVGIVAGAFGGATIAEELADPEAQSPELAAEIDALAKQNGISVLGTGVNPGFVLDLLIVTLTAGCHSVERIEASRINDLSPYGHTVMKSQGVGTTPEAFRAGLADGTIVGHVGFPESIHLISEALGLGVDRVLQSQELYVASAR